MLAAVFAYTYHRVAPARVARAAVGKVGSLMTIPVGSKLGPYEIISPLGAGGMGEVYRARDARLDRDVAVKVLLGDLVEDPRAHSRFEREAKAIARLSHPNILAIYDVGSEGGVFFVVTELLEGQSLRESIRDGVS